MNSKNKFNINEIRNYMTNNKTNINEDHLITDVNLNNISFKDKNKDKNYESLESSNNNELVMNKNYNYNPKSISNNSSQNYYSNKYDIIHNNILSISFPENNKYNNTDNYQYYSEQKVFNPGLLIDFSTKKSTRSTNSRFENDNEIVKEDINFDKNKARSSLNNMINEYIDNNDIYNDNDLDENENNIKDNKMTMNSFDSPQKNDDCNDNDNDSYKDDNNNIEFSGNKTTNSEKMNLNNEEINNLLDDKIDNNKSVKINENEEIQLSNNYISSKGNKKEKEKEKNIKKNTKNTILKQKNKINDDDNIDKLINNVNKMNKKKIIEGMPFQGNYIDYKAYEKYILGNNHDELLNTGNEEDIFGNFVDNIIKKSYHIYTNRQCPLCANLLTNGKSCIKCPKYHHLIKSGKTKKIKNKK